MAVHCRQCGRVLRRAQWDDGFCSADCAGKHHAAQILDGFKKDLEQVVLKGGEDAE